jgi:hypothetical protein
MSDVLSGLGVSLEKTAYDLFGGAVSDYGTQILGSIGGDILSSTTGSADGETVLPFSGAWQSTKYAADLIQYAPKHRFMFKVDFKFNPTYVEKLMGGKDKGAFTFVVKTIDRPKVSFVYEDINFYNFRTKVLKEIQHEALSMTFFDDIGNNVTDFFNAYRKALSPISRNEFPTGLNPLIAQQTGMNFSFPLLENQQDTATRGFLANNAINVLESIIIRQIFAHGTRMVEFTFHNPKIVRFDFDEVDHSSTGDGNVLSAQFDYDALYVSEVKNPNGTPAPMWGKTDILGNRAGSTTTGVSPNDRIAGGIFDSVINAGTRVIGGAASGVISNAVRNIPIIGPQLAGYAGSMTNKVITSIGRDTLRTAAQAVNNSIAKPETPTVSSDDNASSSDNTDSGSDN